MTCNHPSEPTGIDPVAGWEPALNQLHHLPVEALERLVSAWLRRIGWHAGVTKLRQFGAITLQAADDGPTLSLTIGVRVHQRRSRLQPHHVDAFAGYLTRTGLSAGLLISTGDLTQAAIDAADAHTTPKVRLYSGMEWICELQQRRVGLRRRSLWHWILASSFIGRRMGKEAR